MPPPTDLASRAVACSPGAAAGCRRRALRVHARPPQLPAQVGVGVGGVHRCTHSWQDCACPGPLPCSRASVGRSRSRQACPAESSLPASLPAVQRLFHLPDAGGDPAGSASTWMCTELAHGLGGGARRPGPALLGVSVPCPVPALDPSPPTARLPVCCCTLCPVQMAPYREALGRVFFGRELHGAPFYTLTYLSLLAFYLIAMVAGSIWRPLQFVGATAGGEVGWVGGLVAMPCASTLPPNGQQGAPGSCPWCECLLIAAGCCPPQA